MMWQKVARLVFFVLLIALPAAAQTTSGSISGTVIDAQGAVVPEATVTARNLEQNTSQTTATNAAGVFVFPRLQPSRYTITVEKAGFKKFEQREMVLNANSSISVGTVALEVGAIGQTVEVVAQGAQLQTETAERGDTIVGTQLQNLEVTGRSYLALLKVMPGMYSDRDFSTNTNELGNIYANGSRGNQQNLTLNGASNTDYGANGRMLVSVSLDAVQEMKVLTSNYDAQYGKGAGAQISVVTKSGTQDFHGSGYWYFRDKSMNATNWMNNRDGLAKPQYHYNYAGYTLGGPAYIPGKFNTKKDKLFFFWSDEYQRQLNPESRRNVTVPTDLERQGDFSQSVDKNGTLVNLIRDPLAGKPCTSSDRSGCFQDQGVLGKIPLARQYAPGIALLKFFPAANTPGQRGYNFVSQISGTIPRHEQVLKLDYYATPKWRIAGSFINLAQDVVKSYYCPSGYSLCTNFPTSPISFDHPGRMFAVNVTTTINPTMTNEFQFDTNYHPVTITPDNPETWMRDKTGVTLPTLFQPYAGWLPDFDFNGTRISNSPYMRQNGEWLPFQSRARVWEIADNFSKVHDTHFFKAGVFFHQDVKDQNAYTPTEGRYNWGDSSTNPYDTGFGFANAAAGVFSSFTQGSRNVKGEYRFKNLEFYAQDTWKVTRRFTLTYGVRAAWIQPFHDAGLNTANFLADKFDGKQAQRLYWPAFDSTGAKVALDPVTGETRSVLDIGKIVPNSGNTLNGIFPAGKGINEYLMQGPGIKWAPRLGIAFDLTGRQSLVFRAGGGAFYDRYQGNEIFNLITNPPAISQVTVVNGFAKDLSLNQALASPVGVTGIDYAGRIPTMYNYSAGIQARLPYATTLDVSYVGSLGRRLLYNYPLNNIPYGAAFLPQNQDPTKVKASPNAVLGSNVYDTNFLRPYRGYGGITIESFGATSNYNSLQMMINRRFASGLFFGVAYTWSKCLATGSDDGTTFRIDGRSREALYARCNFDIAQNLTINYVYPLPKLSKVSGLNNPFTRAVFDDWQISGITTFRNGTPFSVGYSVPTYGSSQLTGSPTEGARIKMIGNPWAGISSDPYNRISAAAFTVPPIGSVGMDSPRNYMTNPGVNNWDMSLQKNIPIREKMQVQIRADTFNVWNHTQFSGVNSTLNFTSYTNPTPANLPYDSTGKLVNKTGFGAISGARSPRVMQIVARFVF